MEDKPNVLMVDDEAPIRKLVQVNLEARGYVVQQAASGQEALSLFSQQAFDLIVLDLAMPDLSGIEVCARVREQSDVPIIVLSAHGEEELKVQALDAGADDFVTKPFGHEELLARMRALRRRATSGGAATGDKIVIHTLTVDLGARRAFVKGVDLHLTRTEFALLAALAQKPESVLTHDELLEQVWGPEYRGSSHYLHVYLGRIRKKMGPEAGPLLETVSGLGYILHSSLPT
jgi:two-component system KDP operon response regulator KdpE